MMEGETETFYSKFTCNFHQSHKAVHLFYKNFPFFIVIKEQEHDNLNYSLLSFSMTKKKQWGKALVSIKEPLKQKNLCLLCWNRAADLCKEKGSAYLVIAQKRSCQQHILLTTSHLRNFFNCPPKCNVFPSGN